LRLLARGAHREGLGEPAAGDRAEAAEPVRRARRGRRAEARNRFGVTVGSGVVVAEVHPDSPADAAGLRRGDVIEEVNGTEIVSATQLRDAVRAAGDDAEVALRIVRAGDAEEVRAKVGKTADDTGEEGRNQLGVTVGPGVVVAEVLPETPAAAAGLERGDVIDDVNGTAVLSGEQFRQVVQQLPAGSEAALRVTRAGHVREVRARLEPAGG
jgi:S1-C subfamily serine protease